MTGVVAREDLAALVAKLQHEHFGYDVAGAAAARAFKVLAAASETKAVAIAIVDQAGGQ